MTEYITPARLQMAARQLGAFGQGEVEDYMAGNVSGLNEVDISYLKWKQKQGFRQKLTDIADVTKQMNTEAVGNPLGTLKGLGALGAKLVYFVAGYDTEVDHLKPQTQEELAHYGKWTEEELYACRRMENQNLYCRDNYARRIQDILNRQTAQQDKFAKQSEWNRRMQEKESECVQNNFMMWKENSPDMEGSDRASAQRACHEYAYCQLQTEDDCGKFVDLRRTACMDRDGDLCKMALKKEKPQLFKRYEQYVGIEQAYAAAKAPVDRSDRLNPQRGTSYKKKEGEACMPGWVEQGGNCEWHPKWEQSNLGSLSTYYH